MSSNRIVNKSEMGGATFSCLSGNCAGDSSLNDRASIEIPAGELLAIPPRPDVVTDIEINNPIMPEETEEIFQNVDQPSTPDTGSQESVMSAISPTKDRAPSPHR